MLDESFLDETFNWIILKDDDKFFPLWHRGKAIVNESIKTKGLGLEDLESLKKQTFEIIDQELKKYFTELYESKPRNIAANSPPKSFGL